MEEVIWEIPRDVRAALAKLGLTLEPLQEAVRVGYAIGRISRTENDAPSAPGFYQWNETVKALREQLVVTKGWFRNNGGGLPTVVNPQDTIAIAVYSGNENTGTHKTPSTKYQKGPCTTCMVEANAEQLELGIEVPQIAPVQPSLDSNVIATWALLFYADKEEIRSELSLPTVINGGQINQWRKRIILPAIPLDGDEYRGTKEPDFGPDVDIEIRRRA